VGADPRRRPAALSGIPPELTIADVIARLHAIESSAPRGDGVACFARLYREVTEGVQAELAAARFADPAFLERLDVAFAQLFFDACDARAAPPAWVPLFAARSQKGIAPIQFALAGMNAHINRDLPLALVSVRTDLDESSPQHADFERVDVLLAHVEARVKASYLTGWAAALDRVLHRVHRLDDVLAMWDVSRARDAAWTNAQALWALRDESTLRDEFVAALDRMVGFAGRGLLVPAETFLRRVLR
jgi:uncharacterized protein DUF5995